MKKSSPIDQNSSKEVSEKWSSIFNADAEGFSHDFYDKLWKTPTISREWLHALDEEESERS